MTPPPEGEMHADPEPEISAADVAFGSAMDEIEDDEIDDEEEVDLSTPVSSLPLPGSAEVAPSLVSQITPSKSIAGARAVRERAVAAVIETDEEFKEFLSSFDEANKSHKISIHRRVPKKYKGVEIEGFLDEFTRPVSLAEMKESYGGGTYQVYITGKRSMDSNARGPKANVMVKISGFPRIVREDQEEGGGGGWAKDLVKDTMQAAEREKDALRETLREVKEDARIASDKLEKRMTEMMLAQQNAGKMSPAEIQLQLEREKAEREERAEERRIERDDRNRREDKAAERDREHAKEMAEFQLRMAQMQADSRQEAARAQVEAANNQNKLMQTMMANKNDDKTLTFLQATLEQRAQQSEANQKFMLEAQSQSSKMQIEQMASLQTAKDNFFANALKAQGKGGGIADLIALGTQVKELSGLGLFGGGGDEDKGLAQQVLEGAKDLLPAFGAAAQAFRGPQGALPAQTQTQPQGMAPGTVAEVDLPPEPGGAGREAESLIALSSEERKQARARRRQARADEQARYGTGPEQEAPPQPAAAPEPEVLAPEAAPAPAVDPGFVVGEEFVLLPTDRQLEMADEIQVLGHNIELALRRDMEVDDFYPEHVQLSAETRAFLKGVTGEQCVDFLGMQVPLDWRIKTPMGSRFIRGLHAYVATGS